MKYINGLNRHLLMESLFSINVHVYQKYLQCNSRTQTRTYTRILVGIQRKNMSLTSIHLIYCILYIIQHIILHAQCMYAPNTLHHNVKYIEGWIENRRTIWYGNQFNCLTWKQTPATHITLLYSIHAAQPLPAQSNVSVHNGEMKIDKSKWYFGDDAVFDSLPNH